MAGGVSPHATLSRRASAAPCSHRDVRTASARAIAKRVMPWAGRLAYNSCRNRHCAEVPDAREKALARPAACRSAPVEYFHIVFTLPQP